jgi:cytochrome b-561
MFAIVGNDPRAGYPILLGLGELFGLYSIILVGLIFDKNVPPKNKYVYNWPDSPFGYHPLMMTLGLLFCYGNAILLYRTFTTTSKMLMKILHALLLILSLLFAAIGLTAIIRNKNINKAPHFMTYHSWLGLTTIILFVFQWICGFVCFLFPQLSLNIRKGYMPT